MNNIYKVTLNDYLYLIESSFKILDIKLINNNIIDYDTIHILSGLGLYYLTPTSLLFNANFENNYVGIIWITLKPYILEHIRNEKLNQLLL